MARLTKGPGDKVIAGQKRVANAAKVAANKAKVEANRKKVQANAAKYKTSTSTTSTKKSPALANQKVATKTTPTAKVTAKATGYGFIPLSEGIKSKKENYPGEFRASEKQYKSQVYNTKLPADSSKYFQTLSKINPSIGEATRVSMSKEQSRVKSLFPSATFSYSKAAGNSPKSATPKMQVKFNTPVNKMTPAQKAYYDRWNRSK